MTYFSIISGIVFICFFTTSPVLASVYPHAGVNSGAWPDSIPIEVPPSVNNAVPNIAIEHDHRHRDGVMGTGYRLSATSVITRHSASGGVPTIGGDDFGSTFRLNGEPLIYFDSKLQGVRTVTPAWTGFSGAASIFGDHFEPTSFTGARLSYSPVDNAWTMRNRGWTWIFGSRVDTGTNATKMQAVDLLTNGLEAGLSGALDEASSPLGQVGPQCADGTQLCTTVAWFLSKSIDPNGNQVLFDYEVPKLSDELAERLGRHTTHQHLLTKITYSGGAASVTFSYEFRPDPRLIAASGLPTVLQERLTGISSEVQGKPYSDYAIAYLDAEESDSRQTLVRRIIRRDTSSKVERVLRLVDTHRAFPTWPSWDEAESLSALIAQPEEFDQPRSTVSSIPIEINIDGDGVSDLAVLAWSCTDESSTTCTPSHRVYVATPGKDTLFVDRDTATGTNKTAIDAWEDQLNVYFDGDFAVQGRGYLIGDLDRDGRTEMLVETAPDDEQGDDSQAGPVIWLRHMGNDQFTSGEAAVSGCALRSSRLGDIDGDGLVDLLRVSHRRSDACPAADQVRWVKNTAAAPYFDWESNQTLSMPLEGLRPPQRWRDIVDQENPAAVCYDHQIEPPADFTRNDGAWSSTSDFARFGDFNSDGLLDVAYSQPGCHQWIETPYCEYWTAVPESLYSEIHYGLGDGTFLASGVHTGMATYEYLEAVAIPGTDTDPNLPEGNDVGDILDPGEISSKASARSSAGLQRARPGQTGEAGLRSLAKAGSSAWCVPEPKNNALFATDLDRSGYASLIRSEQGISELAAAYDRGLLDGYRLSAAQLVPQDISGDTSLARGRINLAWIFGDFDGDGFSDRIAMQRTGWDVRLARSNQEIAQGRVTSSEASWGGRTNLTWGFSNSPEHDNPNLSVGMEVLREIDGRLGKYAFRYGSGHRPRSGFRGFGWVERSNERGARSEFGFYTDHARWGKPSYGARYRADGTIDRASVYIVGKRGNEAGTYSYDLIPPYFSPVLRQCDFEVGRTSEQDSMVSIQGLIEDCHELGDQTIGKGPFGVFESVIDIDTQLADWWLVGHPSMIGMQNSAPVDVPEAVVSSNDRVQADIDRRANLGSRETPDDRDETVQTQDLISKRDLSDSLAPVLDVDISPVEGIDLGLLVSRQSLTSKAVADGMVVDPSNGLIPVPTEHWGLERNPTAFRWPLPEGLKVPEDPQLPLLLPIDAPPAVKGYIKDFYFDHAKRRLDLVVDQRSTETHNDDLETALVWEKTSSQGHWYRLIEAEISGYGGEQYAKITRGEFASHGFNLAGTSTHCGRSDAACRTERFFWYENGLLKKHEYPDGTTDSWAYDPVCGAVTQHIDAVGRVRSFAYDDLCRRSSEQYLTTASTFDYDGLNRLRKTRHEPGESMPVLTITTLQDDVFANRLDIGFEEPRLARLRQDGQLQLTYLDEHGRTTLKTLCMNGGAQDPANINEVACVPGTEIMADWTGYSNDGHVKARAEPWSEGTTIATSLYTRDEAGRTLAIQHPAHVRADPGENAEAWLLTAFDFGPGWTTRTDPIGRVYRQETAPLERTLKINDKSQVREIWNAYGQMVEREDPGGLLTKYTHDDFNQLASASLSQVSDCWTGEGVSVSFGPCTYILAYSYDEQGRLVEVAYPDGIADMVELDPVGRPLRRWYSDGASRQLLKSWAYTDGDEALLIETRDESGNILRRESDTNGRVTRETFLGITSSWLYHINGKPATKVDTNGLETRYGYDIYDRLIEIDVPDTGVTRFSYDASGRLLQQVDVDGVSTERRYLYSGRLGSRHLADWLLERRGYDDAGRLVKLYEGGNLSRLKYDPFDNRVRIDLGVDSDSRTSSVWIEQTFDASHRPVRKEVWPVGSQSAITRYDYNPWGWLTRIRDAEGHIWLNEYDVRGRVRFTQDPEGYRAETRYDGRGRATQRDLAGADPLQFRYAAGVSHPLAGSGLQMQEIEDGEGSVTTFFYDGLGRKLVRQLADRTAQQWRYSGDRLKSRFFFDADENLQLEQRLVYDANTGRVTGFEGPARPDVFETNEVYTLGVGYSPAGRLTELRIPGSTTTYQRDPAGLVQTEFTDGLIRRSFREGDYPRLTRTELEGNDGRVRATRHSYDAAGRLVEMTTADGTTTEIWRWGDFNAYDQPGWSMSLDSGVEAVSHKWTYSPVGRTLSRQTRLGGALAGVTQWRYFDNGVLREIKSPSGRLERHVYGTPFDHRLVRVENRRGSMHGEVKARNGRGQPTSVQLASGRLLEYDYDNIGRRSAQRSVVGNKLESSWEGQFDSLGRLSSETQRANQQNWRNDYAYDPHGRLEREIVGWSGATYIYGWDVAGNRLSTTISDAEGRRVLTEAGYQGHRLSTVNGVPVRYDPWGALLSDQNGYAYERSASGRLRGVTNGSTRYEIARDAQGLPWAIESAGRQRFHHWGLDPSSLPLEVTSAGGTRAYVAAEGILLERLDSKGAGRVVRSELTYGPDGSLDTFAGNPVFPATAFGEGVIPPRGAQESFLYQGMQMLPKVPGIQLARHRAYDPQTGRFQSPDPAGFLGGPHRYAYVNGDPVNSRDPLGLWSVSIDAGVVASDDGSDSLGSVPSTYLVDPEPPTEGADTRSGPTISEMLEAERRSGCPPGVICHPQGTGMAKEDNTADSAEAGDDAPSSEVADSPEELAALAERYGDWWESEVIGDYGTGYAPGPAVDPFSGEETDGYASIRLQAFEEVGAERMQSAMEAINRLTEMAMDPIATLRDVTPLGQVISGQKSLLQAAIEQNALVWGVRTFGGTVASGITGLANVPSAGTQILTSENPEAVKAGINGLVDSVSAQVDAVSMLSGSVVFKTALKNIATKGYKRGVGTVPRVPDGRLSTTTRNPVPAALQASKSKLDLPEASRLLGKEVTGWKEVTFGELRQLRDSGLITQGQFSKTLRGQTSKAKKALVDEMEDASGYATVRMGDWFLPAPPKWAKSGKNTHGGHQGHPHAELIESYPDDMTVYDFRKTTSEGVFPEQAKSNRDTGAAISRRDEEIRTEH